ncbi:MAG: CRTAC1 family protein [Terriglobia bacterium]
MNSAEVNEERESVYFVDIARQAGVTARNVYGGASAKKYIIETTGSGAALFDFDNDGWLDIFLVNGSTLAGAPPGEEPVNHLYRNNGDATFSDVTERAGLVRSGWGQGVCAGDYDNDGFVDLFVTYWGQNVLYHNEGNGSFRDVTLPAGFKSDRRRWSTGCAFLDYDRDGSLDLVVANYVDFDPKATPAPGETPYCRWKGIPVMCGPRGLKGGTNLLFRNNGDGTFSDVSEKAGITHPDGYYSFTPLTGDFDNDGWPDIYMSCDSTPNILYHNNGDGTFSDIAVEGGAAYNQDGMEQAGMGVSAGDYDGDGWLDIVVTNFSDDTSTLYRNLGDGTFVDATFESGIGVNTRYLGWGTGFVDVDLDGWKDVFIANGHVYPEVDTHGLNATYQEPRLLYLNLGNGKFRDISQRAGPGVTDQRSGRGVAFGDIDNDGLLEILINNMNDVPSLLKNTGTTPKAVLLIRTIGTKSNRDGIGARVVVRVGDRMQVDEVRSGGSYISQNDFRLHFALGGSSRADQVRVRWPSGLVEELEAVEANQIITVREGSGIVKREPLRKR